MHYIMLLEKKVAIEVHNSAMDGQISCLELGRIHHFNLRYDYAC
jgi:hypothetical protein